MTGANKVQLCLGSSDDGSEEDGKGFGLPRALVERMPLITVGEEARASADDGAGATDDCSKTCRICLSNYEVGDTARVLPCFHKFHSNEIDDWLDRNTTCPLCHLDVSEALTGSSGVAFLTAVEGNPTPFADRRRRR